MRARHSSASWMVCWLSAITLVAAASDLRLIEAIKEGDATAVNALLKQGVDVNAPAADGVTALHWAVYHEDLPTVQRLIQARANVNTPNDLGVTPLWLASESTNSANIGIGAALLEAGANPNVAPTTGGTALMRASRRGNAGLVKLLLRHGADVNAKEGANSQTALMWAVAQRHPDVVEALLEGGADVHVRSKPSRRFILLCCPTYLGDPEGAIEVAEGGLTPLLFAALEGDIDIARRLLAAGADVNDMSAAGASVLTLAAYRGHSTFATFLLEKGANPNAANAGYTALHSAVLRGDLGLIKTLLVHGANPNTRLTNGTPLKRGSREYAFERTLTGATPFLLATRLANIELMRTLVASGADPTVPLQDGRTPLMVVSEARTNGTPTRLGEREVLEAVKVAIDLGADVNATSLVGETALHIAVAKKFNTIVQLLADCGAMLNRRNNAGQTPLDIALAPPTMPKGSSVDRELVKWRTDYAAWVANKGRTPTVDLLRKLGAN